MAVTKLDYSKIQVGTYVWKDYPGGSYPDDKYLYVHAGIYESFLRFDTSEIPKNALVSSVRLHLRVEESSQVTIKVGNVLDQTFDSNIIWYRKPDITGPFETQSVYVPSGAEAKWVVFDIKSIWDVNRIQNGVLGTLSLGLTTTGSSARINSDNATSIAYRPYLEVEYTTNNTPTLLLNTENNRTLYENDTLSIDGSATDADNGNIVNVKYSINGGTVRAIATAISNGTAPIPFAKTLTCKNGKLFDGETAVTEQLVEGTANTLRVWAEDDQGGKSTEQTRTFYVTPNRAATVTIDTLEVVSDLINADKVTITGAVTDPEGQEVIVKYKVNDGAFIEIYRGQSGAFSFDVSLATLNIGNNQVTLQATDSYGFVTTKSFPLAKTENRTALKDATERYTVTPPKGTAQGIIVWVQREVGDLTVGINVSMSAKGEQEQFVAMTLSNTAPVSEGVVEDEFVYDAGAAKEHIVLEVNMHRENVTSNAAIILISGVLS
ncbi:DNRLRE domain-containing protein [Bacillus sp. JJ722]|uniref:DNRLRE domain-containing protein n=1 Tax=Bacillus sp. JJ722 TaxID=3122973 RepID=UPI002FFF3C20